MGKSLNFLNQVGTWCLAQHPFGDTVPSSPGELAGAPVFRPLLQGRLTCLPPAGAGLGSCSPPGRARRGLRPAAIPQQGLLLSLVGPGTSPPRSSKHFHMLLGVQGCRKPAESNRVASIQSPPFQSQELPCLQASALPAAEATGSGSQPCPRGRRCLRLRASWLSGSPRLPGAVDARASHYSHDTVRSALELRHEKRQKLPF